MFRVICKKSSDSCDSHKFFNLKLQFLCSPYLLKSLYIYSYLCTKLKLIFLAESEICIAEAKQLLVRPKKIKWLRSHNIFRAAVSSSISNFFFTLLFLKRDFNARIDSIIYWSNKNISLANKICTELLTSMINMKSDRKVNAAKKVIPFRTLKNVIFCNSRLKNVFSGHLNNEINLATKKAVYII